MTKPYRIQFGVFGLPRVTANARQHWGDRYRETSFWKRQVWLATAGKKPPAPLKRAKLTLVRYSSVECDFDNLASSWKPVIDGLVECGILEDDKQANIGQPEMVWEKTSPKGGRIWVSVEEILE